MYLPLPPKQGAAPSQPGVAVGERRERPKGDGDDGFVDGDGEATVVLVRRVAQLEAELQGAAKKVAVAQCLTARVGDLSSGKCGLTHLWVVWMRRPSDRTDQVSWDTGMTRTSGLQSKS
jgi:hypothetical protein